MYAGSNKGVNFKAIPKGLPKADEHLELVHRTIDIENLKLDENEIVLRNLYLSIDPYIRVTLREPHIKSSLPLSQVGQIINGLGVSEVVKSNSPTYKVGDLVYGSIGWEEYSRVPGVDYKLIDKKSINEIPLSYHIGILNMGGLTCYASLTTIGKPKKGETIYISAAAGATGKLVGQMAKIKGLKVVGSTGSDEKVDFLLNELKFDAAFNYKKVDPDKALSELCPDGIDIYFDNVGGETLEIALDHCNKFARVISCGMVSQYNISNPKEKYGVKNLDILFQKSICIQGFLVFEFAGTDIEKDFERDFVEWIKTGKIINKETIIDGIENATEAFIDMLNGKTVGKTVVKIADY
uniref:Alkenal double bond reductase n=1 Tax=Marchantia paleacea TaxID=56867 RepID=A0A346FH11_MARPA|nr:alkenal double bond reductase [Marchantia paleacea]